MKRALIAILASLLLAVTACITTAVLCAAYATRDLTRASSFNADFTTARAYLDAQPIYGRDQGYCTTLGYTYIEHVSGSRKAGCIETHAFGWPFQWLYFQINLPFKYSQERSLWDMNRTIEGSVEIQNAAAARMGITAHEFPTRIQLKLASYSLAAWWLPLLVPVLFLYRKSLFKVARTTGTCTTCGYDITSLDKCPECGRT
jgi:hypothetical protein